MIKIYKKLVSFRNLVDERDLMIIRGLAENGRIPLEKIGERIGISRVAVTKRLRNMTNRGLLKVGAMINPNKLDFKVLFISIEVANYEDLRKLVEIYKNCPRIISLIHAAGGYNLLALMYAEDERTLMSILSGCSIRTRKEVRRSEVSVGRFIYPKYLPITLSSGGEDEVTPCGLSCDKCERYNAEECIGCPSTRFYRPIWFRSRKKERV